MDGMYEAGVSAATAFPHLTGLPPSPNPSRKREGRREVTGVGAQVPLSPRGRGPG